MSVPRCSPRLLPPNVRRIALDSLADAVALLGQRPLSDRAVHGVRKALKRARAMLRLMRDGLGEHEYHRGNTALRDVARDLSAARDGKALLDTLRNLPRHGSTSDLRSRLRKEQALARSHLRTDVSSLKHARRTLRTVGRALSEFSGERFDWPILQMGLRRVYARAQAALVQARRHPTAENWHELRKQTKYLWHQLQTLPAVRPREAPCLVTAAHHLSDLLGGEHDLTALRRRALEAPVHGGTRTWLLAHIDARSARQRDQAMTLASQIYRDPPAVFTARVLRGWARHPVARTAPTSS
ncbi:MAG: CHAD domain-containing protein [Steroidobacteraceae bacterium]